MLLKTSGAKSKPVSMANFRDLLTHSCLDYPMETIVCKILLIMTCWQNTHRISDKKLHFGKWRSWTGLESIEPLFQCSLSMPFMLIKNMEIFLGKRFHEYN